MTQQEAIQMIVEEVGPGAGKLLASPLCATACPECAAPPHVLYGWQPVVFPRLFEELGDPPYFVLKECCWACGYHSARWLGLDWTQQERKEALECLLLFRVARRLEEFDAREAAGVSGGE
jgi:hypothetical protein